MSSRVRDTLPRRTLPKRRRPHRRRRALVAVAVLVAVVVLVGGGAYALFETQLLAVRTVTVTGAGDEAAAVRAAADVPMRTPMIRLDTGAIERRVLAAVPSVGTVHAHRSWPSTVTLQVVRRTVAAVVAWHGRYALIDRDGVPFRPVQAPPKGLVELRLPHPGPKDPRTRAALSAVLALPPSLEHQVLSVGARTPDSVRLTLTRGRTVIWGGADHSARKAKVLAALLHRPGTTYDLSGGDVVTVR